MVKVFDPEKSTRATKNFGALALLYGSVLFLTAYTSVVFSIVLNDTTDTLAQLFQLLTTDPISHLEYIYKYGIYYIQTFAQNYKLLSLRDYNFLLVKIGIGFGLPFLILISLAIYFREFIAHFEPFKKEASLHGDAHWASEKEIIKAGLRHKKGLLLGIDKKGFFINYGFQHALLFAPTGSGKGVGFIIPNCLYWEESLVCHDIKLENFDYSSRWRRDYLKQKVYCWVPADKDGRSHCYNPLDWISKKPGQMVDDVQKLANIIMPKQEFWTNESRTLLVGIILWLLVDESRPKTFGEVVRMIRSDDLAYHVAAAMDTLGEVMHPIGYINLAAFVGKPDKERSGVTSTLSSGLELWGNPIIDATTARSDFNFNLMKIEPTSVFVGLTPDNIQRLKPLMSIFYQQATAFMSQHLPTKEEKIGVMFIMDEFPTVGKLEQFLAGIAYFRGYKVRLFLVVQDTQQLKGTYEDTGMNSFLSNSTFRITFAANNVETAKLISDLIGNQTVESTSSSKSKFLDFNPGPGSVSVSQSQRALLLPQEVIMLPKDEQILLVEASAPIKSKKIFWFKMPMFVKRQAMGGIELPIQEPVMRRASKKGEGGDAKKLSDD